MAQVGWIEGQGTREWYTGSGRYRQEIIGPCLHRRESGNDKTYYIRRKMRSPNSLGTKRDYHWGTFIPPYTPDLFLGYFEATSNAQESNWNRCWQGAIDERPADPRDDNPQLPPITENNTWTTTPIVQNIDWRIALAVLLAVAALLWWLLKRK